MIVGRYAVVPALVMGGEKIRSDDAERYEVIIYYGDEMIKLSQMTTKDADANRWLKLIDECIVQGDELRQAALGHEE